MKGIFVKFRVILLTLALGLASVPFFSMLHEKWTEVYVEVPQVESSTPLYVTPYERLEVATITQNRELSLYEFGGYYPYCSEVKSLQTQKCEANLEKGRDFVWKHWNAKKQSYIIVDKNDYLFIEPDSSGKWHIAVRSELTTTYSCGKMFNESDIRSLKFMMDINDNSSSKRRKSRLWFFDWEGKGLFSL